LADEGDIEEVNVRRYQMHGPKDNDDVPGYWGWIENYLVFAINEGQGLAIKNIKSRDSSKASCLDTVPANNDALAIHVNIEKMLNLFRSIAKAEGDEDDFAEVEVVLKELGVDKVKAINTRMGFDGPDIVVNELIEIPQPRTGLLTCFKTIDLKTFDMVDAHAVSATAWNCEMSGIYDTIIKAVKAAAGEDFDEVQEEIAEMEEELNFKIRDGLLESLDGQMLFYTLPGGITPQSPQGGLVLVAKLKNVQLWEQSLAAIGKFAAEESDGMVQVSSQQQDGNTIHTWSIAPLAMAQVMPCWVISDDKVVITSSPVLCNLAIEQIKSGKNSIRTTEGFKKVTKKLPDNLTGLKYSDSKVQFNEMMTGIQQFWPMATMFATKSGLKLPFVLPSLTHIAEEMGPSCQYSWFDDKGLRSYYRGTGIEQGIGVVAGGAIGMGVMMPALARAREQARRTVSMSNLKQLTLAVIMYKDDNEGIFPENFDQIKEYIGTSKALESPMKPKDFNGACYIYVQGYSKNAGTSTTKDIIIYENPAICRDKINVAFLDGHVEMMRKDSFLQALEETYQRLGREMPEIKFKN
jgi:prepilin-type processing-associated H-X9-DG protein